MHRPLAAALLLLLPCTATAQSRGDWSLNATLPTSVGATWHITDRWALRPDVDLGRSIGAPFGNVTFVAPALGVLRYLGEEQPTRAFVVGRYTQPVSFREDTDADWGQRAFFLGLGAHHRLDGRPLAVFFEVGPEVSWTSEDVGFASYSTTTWGLRSAIGLSWYPRK